MCKNQGKLDDYKSGQRIPYHSYTNAYPSCLNYDYYKKSIHTLIQGKPFFKRFNNMKSRENNLILERVLREASIELYDRNQVIFLQDRVAIVTMGAVEIRRHNNKDLMKPYIVKKAIEGDIIGWAEGDSSYSSSPLSWLIAM